MSTAVAEEKKTETKLNQLDQLKKFTKVVADTADFESIKEFKPQVILDFTSGDLKFQSITTDDVQVRVYGNTAVETGRSIMNGQDKGQTVPRDTRFTRVWVKQQGRWRLVANHYSSQTTRQ